MGKTQLCRRLRDLPFDPNIPTTHGIQRGEMTLRLDGFPEPVRLNLWDFGGQDVYHGSHALFLHGISQARFLEALEALSSSRRSWRPFGVRGIGLVFARTL